jgi:N-glycosylase/DNA lyase
VSTHPLTDAGPRVQLAACGTSRRVPWGQRWQVGTPAHWVALTEEAMPRLANNERRHRLGETLREEVAACMLGGFGLPFEVGLAAYAAVRNAGLLAPSSRPDAANIELILRAPLRVGPTWRRYRFPAQRASRLAAALAFLDRECPPAEPLAIRNWLLAAPGIGPKTASWVVRNHYDCDDVAIVDVHILRAGVEAAVFDPSWLPTRQYALIEGFFLSWARHGKVRAADLDAVIWAEQADLARIARRRARI